ncbi:MAG TPA: hypothetical protein VF263_07905 [Longimicrobiaceae bacterium]
MNGIRVTWILLLALLAVGCRGEVVAGEQKEVQTVVVGDGPQGGGAALVEGSVRVEGTASLVAENGREIELDPGSRMVRVRLDGSERASVSRTRVPALRYVRARLTFDRVTADVTGGLVVNGQPVRGTVTVALPGRGLVVERDVAMPDPDRVGETLVVELAASTWLAAAAGGEVPASVFAAAVRVRTE